MDVQQLMTWIIQTLVPGAIVYGVTEMRKLRSSIDALTITVATYGEKTITHEKTLDKHELVLDKHDERIRALELKAH